MARHDPHATGHATRSVDRVSGRKTLGWARLKASLHREPGWILEQKPSTRGAVSWVIV